MVFSNAIFDRLAKGPGAAVREDIQNDFPHELLDFNAKSNPLEKWVKHHEGRLGTVILGTYFQALKDSKGENHEVPETSVPVLAVSYLMFLNRDIYMKYSLVERIVLIIPFLRMRSHP